MSTGSKIVCRSFRNRQKSETLARFSCFFHSECKWIFVSPTMYVYRYGVYHAIAIRPKQLPNFIAKEQRQGSFQSSSKVSSCQIELCCFRGCVVYYGTFGLLVFNQC